MQAVAAEYCCIDTTMYVPPNITCSVCSDGSNIDPNAQSTILDNALDSFTCAQVQEGVELLVAADSDNCGVVQSETGVACCPSITASPTTSYPSSSPTTSAPTTAPTDSSTMEPTPDRCASVGGFCANLFDCCSARCNPLTNICLPAIPRPKMSLAEGRGGAGGGPNRGGRGSSRTQRQLRVRG